MSSQLSQNNPERRNLLYTDPYELFRFVTIDEVKNQPHFREIISVGDGSLLGRFTGKSESQEDFDRFGLMDPPERLVARYESPHKYSIDKDKYLVARALIHDKKIATQKRESGKAPKETNILETTVQALYHKLSSEKKEAWANRAFFEGYIQAIIAKATNAKVTTKSVKVDRDEYNIGDNFFEWVLGLKEPDENREINEPILLKILSRLSSQGILDDDDMPDTTNYEVLTEYICDEELLYNGHRDLLEGLFGGNWDRIANDFSRISEKAQWSFERHGPDVVLVLQDEGHMYFTYSTFTYNLLHNKELTMPDPYKAQNFKSKNTAATSADNVHDGNDRYDYKIWSEPDGNVLRDEDFKVSNERYETAYTDDYGLYVMAVGENVLLFEIGPGGYMTKRWKCHIDQWKQMWESAFGSATLQI